MAGAARAAQPLGLGPRPGWEFGARAAYFHDDDPATLRRDWYGGAQARRFFGRATAAELSLDYTRENFGRVNADVFPLMLSLLRYLDAESRGSPLLLAGAGWYPTHTTGVGRLDDFSNRLGVHVGAGYEYWLTREWSADATLRYIWAGDIPTTFGSIEGSGWLLTLGLDFRY